MNDSVTGLYALNASANSTAERNIQLSLLEVICYQFIGPVLCGFGIVGNMLSFFTLLYGNLKDPPYIYIRALAITDTCALLVSFPFMVFCIGSESYNWKWYQIYVFIPFANFFTASSVWITVTMTIERYIVVKFPFWAKSGCSRFGTYVRILLVFCASTLNCIPRFFTYYIIPTEGDAYRVKPTPFMKGRVYYGIDIFCIASLHFMPLVFLGFINALLIFEVHRARVTRKVLNIRNNRETEFQKDQRRLTVTLISIVVLALCFIVPTTVTDIFRFTNFHKTPNGKQIYIVLRNLSNVLLWCNLSLNFVLYCAFNKRFLGILKKIFRRGLKREKYSLLLKVRSSIKTTDATVL